jgi:hypothetical protein
MIPEDKTMINPNNMTYNESLIEPELDSPTTSNSNQAHDNNDDLPLCPLEEEKI